MAKVVRADIAALMRDNERLVRENERLSAYLEYVAMMADVDLPEPEDFTEEDGDDE